MKNRFLCFVVVIITWVGVPKPCQASDLGINAIGVRGGISMNPDQFHGGVFINAGHLLSNLRFQPSFELGIGNGVQLGAANFDALFPFSGSSWRPYAGGGLGVNFVNVTNGVGQGRGMEFELVPNIVGGVEWGGDKSYGYVVEARLGIGNTPDFKISAGITF